MIKSFLTKSNKKNQLEKFKQEPIMPEAFAVFLFKMSLILFSFGK